MSVKRTYIPLVNKVRCTGCGDCSVACPVDLELKEKGEKTILLITNGTCIVQAAELCDGCGNCIEACSQNAIEIKLMEA